MAGTKTLELIATPDVESVPQQIIVYRAGKQSLVETRDTRTGTLSTYYSSPFGGGGQIEGWLRSSDLDRKTRKLIRDAAGISAKRP